MKLVIIESPFAGDEKTIYRNTLYARAAVRDSLLKGLAPIASHLLYTQEGILRDEVPSERQQGIDAGLAWRVVANATRVYTDFGISDGMRYGLALAKDQGIPVTYHTLPEIITGIYEKVFGSLKIRCLCKKFVYIKGESMHVPGTLCKRCNHRRNSHEDYLDNPIRCTDEVDVKA